MTISQVVECYAINCLWQSIDENSMQVCSFPGIIIERFDDPNDVRMPFCSNYEKKEVKKLDKKDT